MFFSLMRQVQQNQFGIIKSPCLTRAKNTRKQRPVRFEEFDDCIKWWTHRELNENAWSVPIGDIIANGYNLDFSNPSRPDEELPDDPARLISMISSNHEHISTSLEALSKILRDLK
jgi:type I restriction enzyme M protein